MAITLHHIARCSIPPNLQWEIVVVNNHCTDATLRVVEVAQSMLPLRSIEEPRQGLSRARNAGLRAAKGQLVIFTDDDVKPCVEWIASYWRAFMSNPSGYFFGGPVESEFEGARPSEELLAVAPYSVRGFDLGAEEQALPPTKTFLSANWACPLFMIQRTGGFDETKGLNAVPGSQTAGEETDLMCQLRRAGWDGLYLPHARLTHTVPAEKSRVEHIAARCEASASANVPLYRGRTQWLRLFGVPLGVYKTLVVSSVFWRAATILGRSADRSYVTMRSALGSLKGFRAQHLAGKRKATHRLHVLMIAIKFPPYFAGAAIQALSLAKALQRQGVEVEFFTDNDHEPSVTESYQGVMVFRACTFLKTRNKLQELIYVIRIFLYAAKRRHQVVHFHSMRGFESFIFPLLKLMGKRVIVKTTLVGFDDPLAITQRKMGWIYRWGLRAVDRFACISRKLCELCRQAGIPPSRIVYIPNGVQTSRFTPLAPEDKNDVKRTLGLHDARFICLSVGKVEARKGYEFLLRAWSIIQGHLPTAVLLIGGPGNDATNPYYRHLCDIIEKDGLRNVVFLGQLENVAPYMQISDAFLFCSEREGFGTVMIEAMATQVPLIAKELPGVTEDIITEPALGRACASNSPEEFARDTLSMLMTDEPNTRAAASLRIRKRFDIQAIAQQYIDVYRRLLGRAQPPMRVLHVTKTLQLGGAEANLYYLIHGNHREDIEHHVAFTGTGPYEERLRQLRVPLCCVNRREAKVRSLDSLLIVARLVSYINRHRIDVVHTHNYNGHVWGSLAAKLCGVPVVEHVHDPRYEDARWLRERGVARPEQFKHARVFAGLSDAIVVLTPQNKERLQQGFGIDGQKIYLQYNGIPLDGHHSEDHGPLRQRLGIAPHQRVIAAAGRLSPEKNFTLVVEIARLLRSHRPKAVFVIAGDGPQRQMLEQQIRAEGLETSVKLVGFFRQLTDLFAVADVFIQPSLRELHSLAMIEAMSMSVPVVVSRGVGCNDAFITDGENGFLLDPHWPQDWVDVLDWLLSDEELRRSVGRRGRVLVEQECDIRTNTERFARLYQELKH
ncbi:MAG: glycosyltransferase [Candidatus Omnitrophica bacterium]|nr:glycosyltransferase [Candidatus Omnitrophota bacterium]